MTQQAICSGQDTVLEFRLTVGLRKVEGQWMVVTNTIQFRLKADASFR